MEILARHGETILIDDEDANIVAGITWSVLRIRQLAYATARVEGKRVYMHRVVSHAPDGVSVDHINGEGLDNQKANLRFVTHSQNCMNTRKRSNQSSRFRGVYFDKGKGRWRAQVTASGVQTTIGTFESEEAAAVAYDREARLRFGQYGRYNFPNPGEQSA